jgi:predicted transposase/invertase (TIGR01784 family)
LETQLSKEIDNISKYARLDNCCKTLLSNKMILANIMKECVEEFKDFDVDFIAENCIEGTPQVSEVSVHRGNKKPEKIIGANSEDKTIDEGTVYFDIRFTGILPQTGEDIKLIINIEAQNAYNPGYSLVRRGLYYCCRLISAQYETEFTNNHYDDIKKVYSIWICTEPPDYAKNTMTRYKISEENIVGDFKSKPDKYDIMNVIMVCLDKDGENIENSRNRILKLLRVLLSSVVETNKRKVILEENFGIKMSVKLEEEMNDMCNISIGIRESAKEEGRLENQLENDLKQIKQLKNLMNNLKLTFEQAADALGLSESDRENFAAKINS